MWLHKDVTGVDFILLIPNKNKHSSWLWILQIGSIGPILISTDGTLPSLRRPHRPSVNCLCLGEIPFLNKSINLKGNQLW